MKSVRLQLSSESNLAEVLPLVRAYHEFEGFEISESGRVNSVRTLLSDKSLGAIWLIHWNDELVGYIALCLGFSIEFGGLDAFIDEFYISPTFRGKGIGTHVLGQIKTEAKSMNIRAIHLEVARSNIIAQELYSRVHFKTREKYVLMSIEL